AGFAKGNYTLFAYATPVLGETDTADNTLDDGLVYVGLACDLNVDGRVDMKDIGIAVKAFGTTPQTPNWNPNIDVNNDGKIDMKDIGIIIKNFGNADP
ncbi:MAG: dockerin type I domain-containing protein, partial [Candidatus Norongarragalinales archaeon]